MRCLRLRKTEQGESQVDEGDLPLEPGRNHTAKSSDLKATTVSFAETEPTGEPTWHTAPKRQLVLTLGGTLEFQTSQGERFTVEAGDVLLAEDTTGRGHGWRIVGHEPWRRVYVVLADDAEVPFQPKTEAPRR